VGLVVETRCSYFSPIKFPEDIEVGLTVVELGTRRVQDEIDIFTPDEDRARAR